MRTIFISDLHLNSLRPDITATFMQFIQNEAPEAQALYILGDLFEYWVGDDDDTPLHREVISALLQLTTRNVPVYFIHGNRDLLVGKRFAKQSACTILPDPCIIELYGKRLLLMHGDTLCTDDHRYQRYRKIAHNWFVQKGFLLLPLWKRRKIVNNMRKTSQSHTLETASDIMDVNQEAVNAMMKKHQVSTLIHGHTHRPALHEFTLNETPAKRYVLASWETQGHMLIWHENGQVEEQYFN